MTTKISYTVAFLTGLGMIFLGTRFFLSPEAATTAYGIHYEAGGDYSFHYIKGIRDLFSGVLICIFVVINERRALGLTLLAGTIIPGTDLFIVLGKSYTGLVEAMPHIIAIIICAVFGLFLLTTKPRKKSL